MNKNAKFTVKYEDSDGCEEAIIGIFETRQKAIKWMFDFADTKAIGCEVKKVSTEGFERVEIKHHLGTICDLSILRYYPRNDFKSNWST